MLVRENSGSYSVYINKSFVLDCYDFARKGECLASFANSSVGCVLKCNRAIKAVQNCTINKNLKIVSTSNISIGDEIFVSYSKHYKFPTESSISVLEILKI